MATYLAIAVLVLIVLGLGSSIVLYNMRRAWYDRLGGILPWWGNLLVGIGSLWALAWALEVLWQWHLWGGMVGTSIGWATRTLMDRPWRHPAPPDAPGCA